LEGSGSEASRTPGFIQPELESEPFIRLLDKIAAALILNGQNPDFIVNCSAETLLYLAKTLAERNNPDARENRPVVMGTDEMLMDFFGG
jgi:hypothetical protein